MKLLLVVFLVLAIALLLARRAKAETPAPLARPAGTRSMPEVEDAIRRLVEAQGANAAGEIRAEAGEGGGVGDGAAFDVGDEDRHRVDFASPEFEAAQGGAPSMGDLLEELRAASKQDEKGPWYYLIAQARPGAPLQFEYFLERDPLQSIGQLRLHEHDFVPSYVYRQRFDAALVAELSDFEVNAGIGVHVPDRIAAGKPVSRALAELMATIDWEGDVNNGGMDQYFAHDHSDYTDEDRASLYPLVYAGLERIGAQDAAALFAESIALWAHFHPRVEAARDAMGIAAVPRQDESDIGGRYYDYQPELDRLRAAYVRAHPEILEAR